MYARSGNSGKHGETAHDAYPDPGMQHGNAPTHAITGNDSARKVTQIGSNEGHPGKHRDSLQTKSARIAEILRQPENVKPPDRIGETAAKHNAPNISVLQQLQPSLRAALRRSRRRILPGAD